MKKIFLKLSAQTNVGAQILLFLEQFPTKYCFSLNPHSLTHFSKPGTAPEVLSRRRGVGWGFAHSKGACETEDIIFITILSGNSVRISFHV